MSDASYSLNDLAEAVGIEGRTIRSYIERGLLPGAQTRGRAATYSKEHLSRLHVIRSVRRARPNIGLSEIRIFLQNLSPEQIDRLAAGEIIAAPRVVDVSIAQCDADPRDAGDDTNEIVRAIDWQGSSARLTGVERLVCLLREVSGFTPQTLASRIEVWQRIAVTPDIELSVRTGLDDNLMAAFRELADLLRNLLQSTSAFSTKGDE